MNQHVTNTENSVKSSTLSRTRRAYLLAVVCTAITAVCNTSDAGYGDRRVYVQNLSNFPVVGVIEFYSYADGGSGYYDIHNPTSENRKYHIRIHLNDGRVSAHVVHADSGRRSGRASFYSAGYRRCGIDHVELIYSRPE